jgi:hypothetical protein
MCLLLSVPIINFPYTPKYFQITLLLTYWWLFIHSAYLKQTWSKLSCIASFIQVIVSMQNLLSSPSPLTTTIRMISYRKDLPSLSITSIPSSTKCKLISLLQCTTSAVARPNACTTVQFRSRNAWCESTLVSHKNMDFVLYRFSSKVNANFSL